MMEKYSDLVTLCVVVRHLSRSMSPSGQHTGQSDYLMLQLLLSAGTKDICLTSSKEEICCKSMYRYNNNNS